MNSRVLSSIALAVCTIFLFFGAVGILFAVFYYHSWWPVLALGISFASALAPGFCGNYRPNDDLFWVSQDSGYSEQTIRNCRVIGWVILAMLMLGAYAIPIIPWAQSPSVFPWHAVWVTQLAMTLLWHSFILFLRLFIFKATRTDTYGEL
jgi:hypothetical protein